MHLFLGLLVAMSVTMALIPLLTQHAARLGILDLPESRKVHTVPVARVGGIAMAVGLLLAIVLIGGFPRQIQAYCAGVAVLLVFGVWDDRATLSAAPKFLGQALAAAIAFFWGDACIETVTFGARHELPGWVEWPLSFLFLIGATNAINLADGLDGLAGGTSLMCLCAIALLAFTVGNEPVGTVAVVAIGATLGFLRFNTHPARVFMGDSGSQILGFTVAMLSILVTQSETSPLSSALPLLLLGVPIMDTIIVIVERLLAGRSPFRADRNHLHHKLLVAGLHHHEAVMVIYALQGALFVAAWFMRYESDLVIGAVFAACTLALVVTLRRATQRGAGVRRVAARESALGRRLAWLLAAERLPRWCIAASAACIAAYGALLLALAPPASADVRVLAAVLAVALAVVLIARRGQVAPGWICKGSLYLAAVLAVYLDERTVPHDVLDLAQWVVFPLLAASLLLGVWLSPERRFRLTPLDLLVVFVALAVPNLPGSIAAPSALGIAVAKLVMLFYGIEALGTGTRDRWYLVALSGLIFVCGVALRG